MRSQIRLGQRKGRCRQAGGILAATLTTAIIGLVASSAAPAQAADPCVVHGGNVACVDEWTHKRIDGCDRVNNGLRVRPQYKTAWSYPFIHFGSWDPNGAAAGCSHDYVTASYDHIVEFRVCEELTGCSPWRWIG
jgi:hypothetical protein